jgi:hypothetical protein
LDPLRVLTHNYVPWESPYSYRGTTDAPWDEEELRRSFATAATIKFSSVDDRRYSTTAFFTLPVGGAPSPLVAGSAHLSAGSAGVVGVGAMLLPESPVVPLAPGRDARTLTVTKSGVLVRKDDSIEGGRRASNRKWRECAVVLTGSQLLFFRDSSWINEVLGGEGGEAPASLLRPDEVLSVRGAVAVYDRDYMKVSERVL